MFWVYLRDVCQSISHYYNTYEFIETKGPFGLDCWWFQSLSSSCGFGCVVGQGIRYERMAGEVCLPHG